MRWQWQIIWTLVFIVAFAAFVSAVGVSKGDASRIILGTSSNNTFFWVNASPVVFASNVTSGDGGSFSFNVSVGSSITSGDYFFSFFSNLTEAWDEFNSSEWNVSVYAKSGIIPNSPTLYAPFWATTTHPVTMNNVTDSASHSYSITVNASGAIGTNYELYVLANVSDPDIGGIVSNSSHFFVNISGIKSLNMNVSTGIAVSDLNGNGNFVFRYGPSQKTDRPPKGQSLNNPAFFVCNNDSVVATQLGIKMLPTNTTNYTYWLHNGSNTTGPLFGTYLTSTKQVVSGLSIGSKECMNLSIFSNLTGGFPSGRPGLTNITFDYQA